MIRKDDALFPSLLADAAKDMAEASARPIEAQAKELEEMAAEMRAAGQPREAEFLEMKARDLRFLHGNEGGGDGDPA